MANTNSETPTIKKLDLASSNQNEAYHKLLHRIASLEAENQSLKEPSESMTRVQILHFILAGSGAPSMAYTEEPDWSIGPKGEIILVGHFPITNVDGYLRQNSDIAFVISKYYSPKLQEKEVERATKAKQPLPHPKCSGETLLFYSKEMIAAAEDFFARRPEFAENFPVFNIRMHIPAPYLFWYHYRGSDALQGLSSSHEGLMRLVATWIEDNYGAKYDNVGNQLKRGMISQETVPFLFSPGDVIVWEKRSELHATIAMSWPKQESLATASLQGKVEQDWSNGPRASDEYAMRWNVDCWRYQYDGRFLKKKQGVEIVYSASSDDEEISIRKLSAYPLKYAPERIKTRLKNRGRTFWNCRNRNIVSYEDVKGIYGVS